MAPEDIRLNGRKPDGRPASGQAVEDWPPEDPNVTEAGGSLEDRQTGTDARTVMKSFGLRYSRPREMILGFLLEEDRHVTAESLYLALKRRGEELSLSTVYLNLSALADAGLVCEFKGASGQSLYDSNVSPHYHVVCRETGEILDVPAPTVDGKPIGKFLKEAIEAATGWVVDEPHLSLSGVSPKAAARPRGSEDAPE